MKTLLINLERSKDRLSSATSALKTLDLEFQRVSAVDGETISDTRNLDDFNQQAMRIMGRSLKPGEIGCYLSHMECLRIFLQSDDDFCLVLEDDFALTPTGKSILMHLFETLGNPGALGDFSVINLGKKHKRIFSDLLHIKTPEGFAKLRISHYFPDLLTGLIWSRRGAKRFLAECSFICRPMDVQLQCWIARRGGGLAFDTAPIVNAGFESEIDRPDYIHQAASRHHFEGLACRLKSRWRHLSFYYFGLIRFLLHQASRLTGFRNGPLG